MRSQSVTYRKFDAHREGPEAIYQLYDNVYGDSTAIRERWTWEFLMHPRSAEIAMWVAEAGGLPVGMTVRTPVSIAAQGLLLDACFAKNSMVDPRFRGAGIIRQLYAKAAESNAIQLSKGTAAGMYGVLKRMGYQDIKPSTFQVCLLDPFKWLLVKMAGDRLPVRNENLHVVVVDDAGFRQIEHFPDTFNKFADTAVSGSCGAIVKNAEYMNWRYIKPPHRHYMAYLRESANKIESSLVIRISGSTAFLVDILWDPHQLDEPAKTIKFAKNICRKLGAVKIAAWGNATSLRQELRRQFFFDNAESPNLSFHPNGSEGCDIDWTSVSLVMGDGDAEYL